MPNNTLLRGSGFPNRKEEPQRLGHTDMAHSQSGFRRSIEVPLFGVNIEADKYFLSFEKFFYFAFA